MYGGTKCDATGWGQPCPLDAKGEPERSEGKTSYSGTGVDLSQKSGANIHLHSLKPSQKATL